MILHGNLPPSDAAWEPHWHFYWAKDLKMLWATLKLHLLPVVACDNALMVLHWTQALQGFGWCQVTSTQIGRTTLLFLFSGLQCVCIVAKRLIHNHGKCNLSSWWENTALCAKWCYWIQRPIIVVSVEDVACQVSVLAQEGIRFARRLFSASCSHNSSKHYPSKITKRFPRCGGSNGATQINLSAGCNCIGFALRVPLADTAQKSIVAGMLKCSHCPQHCFCGCQEAA